MFFSQSFQDRLERALQWAEQRMRQEQSQRLSPMASVFVPVDITQVDRLGAGSGSGSGSQPEEFVYTWHEVGPDSQGNFVPVDGGLYGGSGEAPLLERNNFQLSQLPAYALIRQRTVTAERGPVWEFDATISQETPVELRRGSGSQSIADYGIQLLEDLCLYYDVAACGGSLTTGPGGSGTGSGSQVGSGSGSAGTGGPAGSSGSAGTGGSGSEVHPEPDPNAPQQLSSAEQPLFPSIGSGTTALTFWHRKRFRKVYLPPSWRIGGPQCSDLEQCTEAFCGSAPPGTEIDFCSYLVPSNLILEIQVASGAATHYPGIDVLDGLIVPATYQSLNNGTHFTTQAGWEFTTASIACPLGGNPVRLLGRFGCCDGQTENAFRPATALFWCTDEAEHLCTTLNRTQFISFDVDPFSVRYQIQHDGVHASVLLTLRDI